MTPLLILAYGLAATTSALLSVSSWRRGRLAAAFGAYAAVGAGNAAWSATDLVMVFQRTDAGAMVAESLLLLSVAAVSTSDLCLFMTITDRIWRPSRRL